MQTNGEWREGKGKGKGRGVLASLALFSFSPPSAGASFHLHVPTRHYWAGTVLAKLLWPGQAAQSCACCGKDSRREEVIAVPP